MRIDLTENRDDKRYKMQSLEGEQISHERATFSPRPFPNFLLIPVLFTKRGINRYFFWKYFKAALFCSHLVRHNCFSSVLFGFQKSKCHALQSHLVWQTDATQFTRFSFVSLSLVNKLNIATTNVLPFCRVHVLSGGLTLNLLVLAFIWLPPLKVTPMYLIHRGNHL